MEICHYYVGYYDDKDMGGKPSIIDGPYVDIEKAIDSAALLEQEWKGYELHVIVAYVEVRLV